MATMMHKLPEDIAVGDQFWWGGTEGRRWIHEVVYVNATTVFTAIKGSPSGPCTLPRADVYPSLCFERRAADGNEASSGPKMATRKEY